jgi:small subunit ribosomal protein S8
MSMTDPISDYLARINNALRARHKMVEIPASGLKKEITRVLYEQKYINNYINIDDGRQGIIRIYLKYDPFGNSVITGIKRVSKPGRRQYINVKTMPRVLNNLGIAILTTPKGVMTNREAKKQNVGGEILCYVW